MQFDWTMHCALKFLLDKYFWQNSQRQLPKDAHPQELCHAEELLLTLQLNGGVPGRSPNGFGHANGLGERILGVSEAFGKRFSLTPIAMASNLLAMA